MLLLFVVVFIYAICLHENAYYISHYYMLIERECHGMHTHIYASEYYELFTDIF